jgi:hypothetical protein
MVTGTGLDFKFAISAMQLEQACVDFDLYLSKNTPFEVPDLVSI